MTLLLLPALVASLAAFVLLGAQSDQHRRRWLGNAPLPSTRRIYRRAAWGALALAFALAVAARGWVYGPIWWSALVMVGAGGVFLFLNLVPPRSRG